MPIIFHNPGLIDPRCITTMGVNVKPSSDNPIGFFGTGLKYAIAVLLREHQLITIWRGTEPLHFTVEAADIRGKSFGLISMNGRELGFTTELGKGWKVWQAYRELHCNAADEGGETNAAHGDCTSNFNGRDGETWIVCSGTAIEEAHRSRHDFLLSSKPDIETPFGNIHKHPSKAIFYRGIAVTALDRPSMFTYNLTEPHMLTEDRTLEIHAAHRGISNIVVNLHDQPTIEAIISASNAYAESRFDFDWLSVHVAEPFHHAVRASMKHRTTELNQTALRLHLRTMPSDAPSTIEAMTLSPVQEQQLATALTFAKSLDFAVDAYPIICAERLGKSVFGLALNGKIYVSKAAFEAGTKIVAGTLIEEFLHLREGFIDETRTFQDFLLNRIVTLGERLQGRPL